MTAADQVDETPSIAPTSALLRTEPVHRCPLCGGEGGVAYTALEDRLFGAPGEWRMRRCETCAGLWLDPRPRLDDLHLAYRTYYTHQGTDESAVTPPRRFPRLRRLAFRIPGHGADEVGQRGYLEGPPGTVLDVGCGDGANSRALEDAGWRVTAIDIDPVSIEAARAAGCRDARVASIDEIDEPPGSFDAVISIHAIEHVPDPGAMLRRARALLYPGGVLSIVTPNAESWLARRHGAQWRGLEPPRHLQVYSRRALRAALDDAGFVGVTVHSTQRGAKGMAVARRVATGSAGGPVRSLLAHAEGELVQMVEAARLLHDPNVGEELVAQALAP